jgi:hypothetical protein
VVKNWITDLVIEGSNLATSWQEGKMAEKKDLYGRSGVLAKW